MPLPYKNHVSIQTYKFNTITKKNSKNLALKEKRLQLCHPLRWYNLKTCLKLTLCYVITTSISIADSHETISIHSTGNARDTFTLPMQTTIIDASDLQHHFASNITDLVKMLAGIEVSGTSRANGQSISMRGYGSNGVLVLVDGIAQGINTGHTDGLFVDSSLIKSVEIVRGPNALLYGSGALGGVVAYQTVDANDLLRPDANLGFHHFLETQSGNNSFGSGMSIYGRSDTYDGILSLVYRDVGDIKQSTLNSPNNEEIINILAKGKYNITDEHKIGGQLRFYNNQALQPRNPQQNAQRPGTESTADILKATLVDRTTNQHDVQVNYGYIPSNQKLINLETMLHHRMIEINETRKNTAMSSAKEKRKQTTDGIKLTNRSQLLWPQRLTQDLIYGTEYYQEKQIPNAAASPLFPDATINFTGVWFQDELTLHQVPITLLLGTRYDNYEAKSPIHKAVKANNWSSRAGITYSPTHWLSLFTSYAEAFRAPSLGELYLDSVHFSFGPNYTNYFIPNPNLRPEHNQTVELGFGLRFDDKLIQNDNFTLKLSYFDTKARDYISRTVDMNFTTPPFPFPPNMPWGVGSTNSINIDSASISGYDAQLQYQTAYFDSKLNYSRVKGKDDNTGKWIDDIMPDSISSYITIPLGETNLNLSWQGKFVGRTTRINKGTVPQSGYGLHNLYLNYENSIIIPNITIALGFDNLTDKSYYSPLGVPGTKRNVMVKASYRF
ncbi:TonB-dependent hemoglobin/transferrin/lactoferrin family receptor [Thorsellia anophelis]|uniref:Hemoglobin/transferrin/lactoferrin receptor protein n=1 Tax=Thorsellia anophelis DSM 18579 TaxID=1123402 RepID=A0A1I0EUG5_9GAMM|nr:TonB-dependent hemoglobin/transferrin/lactoferrin family receptor [Thorsellia anophelis]SET49080.1 hemoglobin/transferrin/lactoferrin receptor protein [Thorsellia anophelis DSM 18579]